MVAGFEVMSEPRDKQISADVVRDFYAEGCRAVQGADPGTPCMVGNAPYYKLWNFGEVSEARESAKRATRVNL